MQPDLSVLAMNRPVSAAPRPSCACACSARLEPEQVKALLAASQAATERSILQTLAQQAASLPKQLPAQ